MIHPSKFALALLLGLGLSVGSGALAGQKDSDKEPAKDKKEKKAKKTATGTLKVLLPAESTLFIDESPTRSVGPERKFVTPPLSTSKTYYYTLKWTYPDRGRPVTRMAVIEFHAGQETLIDLRPGSKTTLSSQIIYVPTDQDIVEKMLEMAKVTAKDVVYDLGCGDGRIVVTAAKKFGARGVGIDIDPERVRESRANVKKQKVEKLVEIRQGDALKVADLSRATVVTLYMLPEFQKQLVPILKRELKPGSRIASHDYILPGWKEEQVINAQGGYRQHTLYIYLIGDNQEKKEKEKKEKK
ncbi:MAG: TIGR03000 domain-containing protein [Planctomycetes bacterium]|nr:TIGR03000 domain-containing protein [Planctomycetota bacterium]